MNESWDIVVDWLGRHSPQELALIRPPAAEDDIRDAERARYVRPCVAARCR